MRLLKNGCAQSRGDFDGPEGYFPPQLPEAPVGWQDRGDTEDHGRESGYHVVVMRLILCVISMRNGRNNNKTHDESIHDLC